MKKLFLILFFYLSITNSGFTQNKNIYSVGINTSFLYNKFSLGAEFNIWNNVKRDKYIPKLTLKINYGLLGYRTSKINNTTPEQKHVLNYKEAYYSYFRKEVLIGTDISFIKEFKINNSFFFGIGTGWNQVQDKGYELVYNPFTSDSLKTNSKTKFQTISILSNFGYSVLLKNNLIFKSTLNFYFFVPFKNGKQIYYDASMPNVGVELDLSVSLNYTF